MEPHPALVGSRVEISKTSTPPEAVSMFNTLPIKMSMTYFTELEQIFQKLMQNHKRSRMATAVLRKKNQLGHIILPDIKLDSKAIVVKTARHWHQNRHVDHGTEQ